MAREMSIQTSHGYIPFVTRPSLLAEALKARVYVQVSLIHLSNPSISHIALEET